jgi:NAD(P)-dependent dehydrogenase (short-subunit alcohol dehydrogenase family)
MIRKILTYFKNGIQYVKRGGVIYTTVSQIRYGQLFKGKKVLITGGGSGFGYAMAGKFLDEGAEVLITGRNEEKLKHAVSSFRSPNIHYLVWDLLDTAAVSSKFNDALQTIGGDFDIFINNAGVWKNTKFLKVSEKEWDMIVDTNLKGLFFIMQEETNYLLSANKEGKIINITSVEGIRTDFNPYSASKWGANDLTRGLAKQLAPKGIIINAIAPGVALTDINRELKDEAGDNEYYPVHRTGRFTKVEEVAELAAFLASNAANNIVGQIIAIDGGWTLI